MRLVTLAHAHSPRAGVQVDDDVLDLQACADIQSTARRVPNSMRALLAAGDEALDTVRRIVDDVRADRGGLRERLRTKGALVPLAKAKLLAPVPDPGAILSCGMNYHAHLKEMNTPVPEKPTAFFKSVTAVIGPGAPIVPPAKHAGMVDWEGEFSVVIGRACHNVSASEALDCVAGYTLVNDVSARDWVAPVFQAKGTMPAIHAWEENILGKQFPTFCPMGPVIVTRDELRDPGHVQLKTIVNGEVMQSTSTDDLVFGIERLIEHYSQFYLFRPGDVITTGSPAGVGYGRAPKVFLKAGDRVEVWAEGVGTLSNPVAAPSRGAGK
jgi:2-keto-4-pentenoate hydratase/2-oxohepta-3-ene-1,7-dioic acid hydratase in catechol pathway